MLDVLLTTEGTYPYHRGGVGTWCDLLVQRMEGVNYHVFAVIATPFVPMRFKLPKSVVGLHSVPLWGTEEPTEHLDLPYSVVYDRKLRTTSSVIRTEFLPLFERMLQQLWQPEPSGEVVAQTTWQMHKFFQRYDYLEAMKSEEVWNYYKTSAIRRAQLGLGPQPSVRDLLQGLGWMYRFFTILTSPVPRADVSHASAAAFCALPAMIAKLAYGTPLLLTEHGIYLREQYLSIGKSELSPFSKNFLLGLVGAVTRATMWAADLVAPVAAYNFRWESRLGVPEKRFQVIYNGVDPSVFVPKPRPDGAPLTVVSVARVDPIKDQETLMRAAVIVRQKMPEVKFVVYGGISVEHYYQRLLALRKELGLEESFIFAGHTANVAAAYQSGDVIALSSISEGFPYGVVEAMMSGRPVVSTDVGGTSEALGGLGILVPPQDPEAMARGILELLGDPQLRRQLADEAHERALTYFTVGRQIELYKRAYERLSRGRRVFALPEVVRLRLERAEALLLVGSAAAAIEQLTAALQADPGGPAAPLILLKLAQAQLLRGNVDGALLEMEKAEALSLVLSDVA